MQTATVLDSKDIEAIRENTAAVREQTEAVRRLLEALTEKGGQEQSNKWMTIEEVCTEIGGKTHKSYIHRKRNDEDFPYEYKRFSGKKVRYRLKDGGGSVGNNPNGEEDQGLKAKKRD